MFPAYVNYCNVQSNKISILGNTVSKKLLRSLYCIIMAAIKLLNKIFFIILSGGPFTI